MNPINKDLIMDAAREAYRKKVAEIANTMIMWCAKEGTTEHIPGLSQVTYSIENVGDTESRIVFHLEALNDEEKKSFEEIYYPNILIERKWS